MCPTVLRRPNAPVRTAAVALGALVAYGALVSCGAEQPSAGSGTTTSGTFAPYADGVAAVTYDEAVVPAGATATLAISEDGSRTTVDLVVTRFRPDRAYGAHLHRSPCGSTGDAAGPHHQHALDPSTPSTDPSFANPTNEVWLDFSTDESGAGEAEASQPWVFGPDRPRSLVIHARATRTGPGEAGTAGARVGCLTLSDG